MEKHKGSTMELSGDINPQGVPMEIIQKREADRAARAAQRKEALAKQQAAATESRRLRSSDRNIE